MLSLADEAGMIDQLADGLPADITLLGIDCYGVDIERNKKRERKSFSPAPAKGKNIIASVKLVLAES